MTGRQPYDVYSMPNTAALSVHSVTPMLHVDNACCVQRPYTQSLFWFTRLLCMQVDVDGDGILVVDADIAPPANLPVADWSEMIQYFIGQDDIGMVRGLCPYLGQAAISPAVVAVAFYSDNYQHLRSLLLACADAAPFKLKLRQYRDYQHAPSEEEYLTPLMHVAIHKGRWDQVETLLFAGVSPRLRATRVIGGTSPHHGALRCAQVRAVEELFRDCQNRVAQKQVTMTRAAFAHS